MSENNNDSGSGGDSGEEEYINPDYRLQILAEIADRAAEMGWVVGLPPDEVPQGIVLGKIEFIESYNSVVSIDDQLEILQKAEEGDLH